MSNSQNMNVSERLAQKLKESELGALLDEDALTTIAQDAIKKAFFEPRTHGLSYNPTQSPPIVVELATESFKTAIDEAIKPVVAKLIEDETFNKMILDAIMATVAAKAMQIADHTVNQSAMRAHEFSMTHLRHTLGQQLKVSF